MSALDPDLVRQLLADGAASIDVWHIDRTETGDGAANVIASCPGTVDQVRASADLAELAPAIAADWLRLRTLLERLINDRGTVLETHTRHRAQSHAITIRSWLSADDMATVASFLPHPTPCPEENPTP